MTSKLNNGIYRVKASPYEELSKCHGREKWTLPGFLRLCSLGRLTACYVVAGLTFAAYQPLIFGFERAGVIASSLFCAKLIAISDTSVMFTSEVTISLSGINILIHRFNELPQGGPICNLFSCMIYH